MCPDIWMIKNMKPRLNGRHFRKQNFQIHFHEWKFSVRISMKFVPKGPVDNKSP